MITDPLLIPPENPGEEPLYLPYRRPREDLKPYKRKTPSTSEYGDGEEDIKPSAALYQEEQQTSSKEPKEKKKQGSLRKPIVFPSFSLYF